VGKRRGRWAHAHDWKWTLGNQRDGARGSRVFASFVKRCWRKRKILHRSNTTSAARHCLRPRAPASSASKHARISRDQRKPQHELARPECGRRRFVLCPAFVDTGIEIERTPARGNSGLQPGSGTVIGSHQKAIKSGKAISPPTIARIHDRTGEGRALYF